MIRSASVIMALASVTPLAAQAAPVEVTISGVQASGKVFGQVFADETSFKARENPVLRFALEPNGPGTVRTTLSLKPGRYAMSLFQDTKGTGKVETSLFGKPLVPYGFSNNAAGMMGPPGFDAAAFDVGSNPLALSIKLR